jgi:hypothetical protein
MHPCAKVHTDFIPGTAEPAKAREHQVRHADKQPAALDCRQLGDNMTVHAQRMGAVHLSAVLDTPPFLWMQASWWAVL